MPPGKNPRIVVDPEGPFCKPCVAGTRTPVRGVLDNHSYDELRFAFPVGTPGQHHIRRLS